MLILTHASLATVNQLFRFKESDFKLDPFPGYTPDQWGIKAHNRPWIVEYGDFNKGQKVIEVGGAYSLLPKCLADTFNLEAWIGDSFGSISNNSVWQRWGDPRELPEQYPSIRYVFEDFGFFSQSYPKAYFDRIFTVSTLEHISRIQRVKVLEDIHRCLQASGKELHTIDIPIKTIKRTLFASLLDYFRGIRKIRRIYTGGIRDWINLFVESGVRIGCTIPNPIQLLDRSILVESPDVVYRFYPPNDSYKPYSASASLLLVVEDIP